jgi:adenine/guanine phosphoribosyltransferase-like PRPP-binding protein
VIDAYLDGEDWDEAPEEMAFEAEYGTLLDEAARLHAELLPLATPSARSCSSALRLYIVAPALVNVILNYKICIEHGLPLHPTVYYELTEARRYRMDHGLAEIERANRLYRSSIELARSAYRLDADFSRRIAVFEASLPEEILRFLYTGGLDKYSWRASEPAKIRALADKIRAEGMSPILTPSLIVAAAHGAIMPSLLLAEYLDLPLYFVRFSMFKRKDEAPILSISDEVWLSSWKDRNVLLYDEDVAKGTTLELFKRRLAPLFAETRTACSIRHAGSSFIPDFVARHWWD